MTLACTDLTLRSVSSSQLWWTPSGVQQVAVKAHRVVLSRGSAINGCAKACRASSLFIRIMDMKRSKLILTCVDRERRI